MSHLPLKTRAATGRTNAREHGRTDCFSLVREQAVGGGSVYSFESQELPYSKLVLSHRIKTTDFPIDFQELLSYQRKASIKCVPPLPLHFGELLSQERPLSAFKFWEDTESVALSYSALKHQL